MLLLITIVAVVNRITDDIMLPVIKESTLRKPQMSFDRTKLQIEAEDSTETIALQRCEDNTLRIEHEIL
ncbi:MAG: hypothetical protein WAZ77_07810 [Candidatus Nitrosopolaris sp.]